MIARVLLVSFLSAAAFAADPFAIELVDPRDGSSARLAAGKPHHVVFIATWCPTCIEDLVPIADLRSRFERSGYELIFVAVSHRQSAERLRQFLDQESLPGPLLHDASGELQRALGAEALPAHVLLEADGSIGGRAGSVEEIVLQVRERRPRARPGGEDP